MATEDAFSVGHGTSVQKQRGILKAMLVVDGAVTCATGDVDPIGVLANLQALVNSSIDMSTLNELKGLFC